MKARISVLLLAVATSSCESSPIYVQADLATYQAISPEYRAYVSADAAMTATQKARRLATVEGWKRRIDAALALTR